mmetsp:Transcript_3283/g.4079  ORF Transcript_3283/g.4079 Transcript_3283/m.4079 type:complete len:136 (-) Transcript_3283:50-457(-)
MELQGNFFAIWGAVYLLAVTAQSSTTLIGCMVTNVKDAMELFPLAFVPQLLFAGFFVQINQIPVWLRWAQWVCSLKYSVNLLLVTEFTEDDDEVDDLFDANDVKRGDAWFYILMLFVLIIVFRISAIFALNMLAK